MNKILLSFSERFWDSTEWFSINSDERGKFCHFCNLSQKGRHILCCFMVADFARKMEYKPKEVIVEELISLLRHVFKNKQVNLRHADVTYWGKD